MNDDALLALLVATADAVASALAAAPSRQLLAGSRSLHHSDLATDAAALAVLGEAGVRVLSEESGLTGPAGAPVTVVVDPLDGSTNAAAGLPWYATSLCAVDAVGPRVAVVRNLATGEQFAAVRGEGATVDGRPFRSPADRCEVLGDALVLLSGHARTHLGWRQYRAMGALALDLCAVAAGRMDAFLDCSVDAHGVWDYLGGVLVAREAGIDVEDVHGRELVVLDPAARRTPVAGPPGLRAVLRRRWPEASGEPLRLGDRSEVA
ncbi:MAG: inositol monophosphatase [Acidimicrobiia bacterium]